ncbi:MAG: hypothetical protein M9939_03010 [Mesorhizobium sp.]|nr:hypothetical protein [Mesorhizobium sp.]MCO5160078.1 hypothetical protein [Mesorhizobium sp.]
MRVDVSSWHFEYQHDTPFHRAFRDYDPSPAPEPESFDFPNADALLRHLDGPGDDDRSRFKNSIDERLRRDPDVAIVMAARTPLKELKHFRAYRGNHYDKYHNAARRISCGNGSEKDQRLIDGLDAEISKSKILLAPGQILFHGRSNDLLVTEHPYPSYVSATLDPIVALNSAYRRAGTNGVNGRLIVFVLETRVPLRALWGHVGQSAEWELLLPRGIDWAETTRWSGNAFDVVHAAAVAAP